MSIADALLDLASFWALPRGTVACCPRPNRGPGGAADLGCVGDGRAGPGRNPAGVCPPTQGGADEAVTGSWVRVGLVGVLAGMATLVTGCASLLPSYQLALLRPILAPQPVFEDDRIAIAFGSKVTPGVTKQLEFELANRSGHVLRILWDEAAFIHVDGTSSRVLHAGVRFIESDRPLPPTTVPAGARVREVAAPADRVRWIGRSWYQDPIVSSNDEGKTVGLLLPIEFADGVRREYHFEFRIEK